MGNRASKYPLSNVFPNGKISAWVSVAEPPVVKTSRLAKISAAVKSCKFRLVVAQALLSATEASHLTGRQGADEVGELGGYVDQLPGSLYRLRCSAATAAGRDCRLASAPTHSGGC